MLPRKHWIHRIFNQESHVSVPLLLRHNLLSSRRKSDNRNFSIFMKAGHRVLVPSPSTKDMTGEPGQTFNLYEICDNDSFPTGEVDQSIWQTWEDGSISIGEKDGFPVIQSSHSPSGRVDLYRFRRVRVLRLDENTSQHPPLISLVQQEPNPRLETGEIISLDTCRYLEDFVDNAT